MYKTNKTELTDKQIIEYIKCHNTLISKYETLQEYYEGDQGILHIEKKDDTAADNRLVNNYSSYITDVNTGYFLGKPIAYTSVDDTFMEELQDVFNSNDEQDVNMELGKTSSIKGTAYEILYIESDERNENNINIKFGKLEPEEVILIYDNKIKPEPVFAIRHYCIDEEIFVSVYTKDKIQNYLLDGESLKFIDEEIHWFNGVPIIEYPNNDERMGDFERTITLIDAYDKGTSNTANTFEDNDDALLKIVNFSGTTKQDIKDMKRSGAILVDGDGDVDWLIKQLNDVALNNYLERINNNIHKMSKTPDLTDEKFAGNVSGIAAEYKLWGMEQNAVQKERKFKKALQRRIKLITNFMRVQSKDYNYRDINITFTRNIPTNTKEIVEMVQELKGIVSDKRALSLLPFIDDVDEELELIEQEKEGLLTLPLVDEPDGTTLSPVDDIIDG